MRPSLPFLAVLAVPLLTFAMPVQAGGDVGPAVAIPALPEPCGDVSVDGVQQCLTDTEQYANEKVDWSRTTVSRFYTRELAPIICSLICPFADASATSAQAEPSPGRDLACGDPTVNGVQECLVWAEAWSRGTADEAIDEATMVTCSLWCPHPGSVA